MAKLKDLSEWELINNPAISLNGDVLCPKCLTNEAIVTDYGMIRMCEDCQKTNVPETFHAIIKENGKKKFY